MEIGNSRTVETWSTDIVPEPELEPHDDYWTAVDPETGIFGSGPDRDAALEDLRQALHEHLEVLDRQEALSEELWAQLVYLRRLLAG